MLLKPKIDWHGTISKAVVMLLVFFLATAAQGEWLLVVVYLGKDYLRAWLHTTDSSLNGTLFTAKTVPLTSVTAVLEYYRLQNLHMYLALAITTSFIMFYGMAGGFQWYFYIKRRHKAYEWKCQPDRWLTLDNERHEIMLGSFNMLLGSTGSGFVSCYIMNGGKCSLYTSVSEVGWTYLFLSAFALFMYNEAVSYYLHRLFHYPYLYRKIHKVHHRYGSPTAFSTVAMHPFEFTTYQVVLALPAFTVPLHAGKYFHCNFGFNSLFFDNLHGTLRKKDRVYGEDVFGGKGKQAGLTDAKSE
ncbi:hypothetical protein ACJMK2_022859 [Sinanodonta woodiana]|uniref:Fatty acid hydroxylase domain-containing protein n=1 Tax=Sinanodonta woodiana TaxID=1069815 RepID=A0ABD3TL56_SINWO